MGTTDEPSVATQRGEAETNFIERVEGVEMSTPVAVRVLAETDQLLLLETEMPAGVGSPLHVHEHQSVGYVVSGHVRLVVDGEVHELGPGDGFFHPIGAKHSMTAVGGDAVWVEVKHPPTRTW